MPRPKKPGIIRDHHRRHIKEFCRLGVDEPIPEHIQETIRLIYEHGRGTPEFYAIKERMEDRFPKGTGYGEENKPKPENAGPAREKPKNKEGRGGNAITWE